jgi:hypothetical protein
MAALANWNNPPHAQREKAVMRTLTLAFLAACAPVLVQTNYGTITFTNKSGDALYEIRERLPFGEQRRSKESWKR